MCLGAARLAMPLEAALIPPHVKQFHDNSLAFPSQKLIINTLASGRFDSNSQQCHLQRCGDARGGTEGESSAEITEPAAEAQILLWAHLSPRKARSVQSSRLMDSVCCRTVCGQYSMR